MKRRKNHAFTLVELLVVVMIMGVIGSVVIACFMGGMRAYEQVYDFGQGEADAYLALELIERDLHNVAAVRSAAFEGNSYVMQFPALSYLDIADDESSDRPAGDVQLVRYWYDVQSGLLRSSAPVKDGVFSVSGDGLAKGGADFSFEYGGYDKGGAFTWSDEWSSSNFPRAVRVNFALGSDKDVTAARTILLPVEGGAGK